MTIRLNKVTRNLNVGIATVVDFLQKKGYTIEANPNTKITDEQYAALVKEFSKDKDLKIESEKIFQERQNKERNKASVSIDDLQAEAKLEVIEAVVPEDARPKFKPVGKIDLDNLNKKKVKPAVVEPAKEEKKEVVETAEPVEKPAPVQVEEVTVAEVAQPQPQINEQQKQPEQEKAEDLIPDLMEEKKETPEAQTVQQDKEDEVFKIRPTEFKSKINVVGQIDLAALNQSTRPKKKTKEEKRKEREEKDKQRLEQRKQMIEGQIADANKLKAEAGDLKKQYEGMLAQAHEESAELLEKTRKSAQAEYENRINVADAEAEKIIENAHKTVELERDKTVQDLQSQIAVLAVAAAGKVLGEASTNENNRLLYQQFLTKAGGVNDADSK